MKAFLLAICLWLVSVSVSAQGPIAPFNVAGFGATNGISQSGSPTAWNQPVGLLFSPDGSKLFVWEKAGKVFVCNRNAGGEYVKQNTPVIDISDEVGNYNDYGLTGFALDPGFASNGLIYLFYVVDQYHLLNADKPGYNPALSTDPAATIGRITRYKTNLGSGSPVLVAQTATRQILLGETKETGLPILHKSHGTGTLIFANDGTLLASAGDGASFDDADTGSSPTTYYQEALTLGIIRPDENVGTFRAQMLTSLNGKILRLDPVTGNGVSSNPYFEELTPRSAKSRVWALGLRNPFRMAQIAGQGSSNPSEGHLGEIFIGDVGFGDWEELNILKTPGTNFGWPIYEGILKMGTFNLNKSNPEAPVPPEIGAMCGGRQFIRFGETIRDDNIARDATIYYPCTTIPFSSDIHHLHVPPALDIQHVKSGSSGNARVPIFLSNGMPDAASIGTPESNVAGTVFAGNSIAAVLPYSNIANGFPPEYTRKVFIADYDQKWIKTLTLDNGGKISRVEDFATNIGAIVCLTENPVDGSIYYVDYTGASQGIKKITFGGNMPPVAKIKADHSFSEHSSQTIFFDGTESSDREDGNNLFYTWNFGDPGYPNNTSTNPKPDHEFVTEFPFAPKKYVVTLTVEDQDDASSTTEYIVSLNNTPPKVKITSPVNGSKYRVAGDTTYTCEATVTDAEHGPGELSYEWQTILAHNSHIHPEPIDTNKTTSTLIDRIGCTGSDTYHWVVTLKVTDGAGLVGVDTARLYPNCSGPLPIFLHKFSVTQNGNSNQVKWTTELESHIEYFDLERSSDGINFTPINRQKGTNASGPNNYTFEDKNFAPGVNYYRLKIVEIGAVVRYSVIIKTITAGERSDLKVVPNPVVDNFSLSYLSPLRERVTIEIRDVSGKLLETIQEDVNKGANIIYMQNLPNWNAGVYVISIKGKEEFKQAKFIKVRK
jgi:glucose/arabinose dehydrogenase